MAGVCGLGFLVFVTFQPRSFQTLFSFSAIFYYGNGNALFPTPENGPGMGQNPGPKSRPSKKSVRMKFIKHHVGA
jgi:hypothetical protein